ncbi:hypothetical protein Tco_1581225, partial [Tanacetum coccineum]
MRWFVGSGQPRKGCVGLGLTTKGCVRLRVNNQGARLAVETAGEGVRLAVGQPGIAGKGRRVWLSLTAGKGAGLAVKQRPTQRVCLAVRVSRGCGMRLVADSTAKGAFCFELDPHRVRLAATAARDVWLAVLTAERVFVLVRWTATHKGAFGCLSHAQGCVRFVVSNQR